tara:strand:+ start:88 stop:1989 length:1902 start_codon:yes stop_codon:yes gene_type:complete
MAMHNFLAESIDFFLKDSTLTSFVSLPDGDANFGNTGNAADNPVQVYSMDMLLSQNRFTGSNWGSLSIQGGAEFGSVYQDSYGDPMMYNHIVVTGALANGAAAPGVTDIQRGNLTGMAYGPPCAAGFGSYEFNMLPFEASHLFYPSVARLSFVPFRGAGEGQVYSLDEILSNMTIKYYHIDGIGGPGANGKASGNGWVDGSQISASINISANPTDLIRVKAKEVTYGAISRAPELLSDSESEVLVLQTRFETPILDFRSGSLASRGIYPQQPFPDRSLVPVGTAYNNAAGMTFGMWHQYGATPPEGEGVFLELRDVDPSDVFNQNLTRWGSLYNLDSPPDMAGQPVTGSLADLMGFKRDAVQLGKPAIEKEIKEAVVAIPYQETPDGKTFYPIAVNDAHFALTLLEENTVLPTSNPYYELAEQFRKMGEYVMPPQFNCIHYDGWRPAPFAEQSPGTVLPISMFIFEFKHQLTSLDVTDIWQNLPPTIHEKMETSTATISDNLLLNDLIQLRGKGPDRDIRNIKFMVFKIKQRAKMNYYRKTLDSADDVRFSYEQLFGRPGSSKDAEPPYSYNWPYDFFSLVELAKIDAAVEYTTGPPPTPSVVGEATDDPGVVDARSSNVAGVIAGAVKGVGE